VIFSCSYEAAQEAAKQQSTCKRKEKIIIISKSISCKTGAFLYLALSGFTN
jgi:hypothetical protein